MSQNTFFDHIGMKLEISSRKKIQKYVKIKPYILKQPMIKKKSQRKLESILRQIKTKPKHTKLYRIQPKQVLGFSCSIVRLAQTSETVFPAGDQIG